MKLSTEEKLRVQNGIQCPECSGVNIETNGMRRSEESFLCTDCGCQWDREYYQS